MDSSDIFGAIGIVVSFLFGAWGIYLALRKARYPASLSFVHEQVIGLFDDVASKIPNLSIIYKNHEIDSKVILVNGYLANDGSKDISPSMIEKQLAATLPNEWKWLECKLLSSAKDLNVTRSISSQTELCFDFGLFRKGESFSFQALISIDDATKVKKTKSLIDRIEWNHRIADLGRVKTIDLPYEKKPLVKYLVPVTAGLMYIIGGISLMFIDPITRPVINYMVPINGEYTEVRVIPKLDGTAKLKALNSDYEENIVLAEYLNTTRAIPKISALENSKYFDVALILMSLGGGVLMLFLGFEKDIKKWRVRKLVGASNNSNEIKL